MILHFMLLWIDQIQMYYYQGDYKLQEFKKKKILMRIRQFNQLGKFMSILLLCLITSICYDLTFQQFLESTPKTFGLLTVTHARGDDYQYFKKHLNRYAQMQCPLISEFSVVWNNQISPQQAGIKILSSWKRPVYIRKTPFNSMDFRYLLPEQSKAQVYFSIDDDVVIDCEELTKGFEFWKSRAIGDIAPLMGYGLRGFDTKLLHAEIRYIDPQKGKFYYLTLIGIAWVPRFFFQLYNSNALYELQQMRKIVQQKNNCDDIALNYLVGYLYPQFISIPMKGNYSMISPRISQGYSRNHYPYRNFCVKTFIEIIGHCPLRLIDDTFDAKIDQKSKMFVNPLLKEILYQKRKLYSQKFLQNKTPSSSQQHFQSIKQQDKILQLTDTTTLPHDQPMQAFTNIKFTGTQDQKMTFIMTKLTQNLNSVTQQNKNLYKKITSLQQQLKNKQETIQNTNIRQISSPNPNITPQTLQITQNSLHTIEIIVLLGVTISICLLLYFGCRKQQQSYHIVHEIQEK